MTTIGNTEELSVSELSRAIKTSLEQKFGRVQVRGEINSLARPNSGHLYFSLVDPMDNTRVQAACWRGSASRLAMRPEDGQEVIVTARLTAYGARSQYQLIVDNIELAGVGALLKMLEERRQKLAKEGLFDAERKRPLPKLPRRIGVITSEKGAVWQDILHRIEDRFPLPVVLCPVLVQGKSAASEVSNALAAMNSLPAEKRPDVLVVARGGGSMEDLLPFHDEGLIRAVAASNIPVVSAIGHETDTTLIDYVADVRAPTPTAAAELIVPVRRDLLQVVVRLGMALNQRVESRIENLRLQTARLQQFFADPHKLLETPQQRLDMAAMRLERGIMHYLDHRQNSVDHLSKRLVSPQQILLRQQSQLENLSSRMARGVKTVDEARALRVQNLFDRLQPPRLHQERQNLSDRGARLQRVLAQKIHLKQEKLLGLGRLLENTSLTRTLERGFALVLDENGGLVTSAQAAKGHKNLTLRFADGEQKVENL